MAITYLGAKSLQGIKTDRVSDSLGSSADGTVEGVTSTPIKTNSSTNKIDFKALRDGVNHALSYDLGATLSDTLWTCRFVINFSKLGSSGNGNYLYVGLSDKDSSTAQNGNQDFIGTQIQADGTSNYFSNDSDGASISGTGSGDNSQSWTPAASTNYYVEIIRSSATAYSITIRTGSHSGTSLGTVSGTCANTTVGLRYFKVLNVINSSGGRDLEGTIDTITIDNGASTYSSADYTVNPNSTTGWSGNYKLGTGAYSFDGSNDRVTTDQRVNGLHDGTGGSVAFWVKPTSSADNDIIFNTHNGSSSGVGVEVKFDSSNRIKVGSTNSSNGWVTANSTTALSNGTWYHVAVTLDTDTKYRIYINGTLEATSSAFTPKTADSSNPYYLGDSPDSGNYYDGLLDDVGIYSRVLTATEIQKLAYNNVSGGEGWDQSGTDHQVSGGKLNINAESRGNHRIWYDLGSAKGDSNFVMRFEMNLTSYDSNNGGASMTFVTLSDNTDGLTSTNDSLNAFNYSSNGWRQSTANGVRNDSTSDQTSSLGSVTANTTYYMQMKRSGTTYTLSQHNSDYSSTTWTNDLSIGSGITGLRYIKVQNGYQGNKVGWIDNIKFWESDTASGSADIDIPFTAGDAQSVSTLSNKAGLKAHYSMNAINAVTLYTTDDFTGESYSHSGTWYNNSNAGNSLDGDKSTSAEGSIYTSHTQSGYYTVDLGASANRTIFVRWDGFAYGGGSSNDAGFKVETSPDNSTWTQRGSEHLVRQSSSYDRDAWIDDLSGTWRYVRFSCRKVSGGNSGIHHVGFGVDWFGDRAGDSCSNDFSATSDLEAMTNLPTNTIFSQTDDTPSYWWKQSDNTWAAEYNYVLGGFSTADSSGFICGGSTSGSGTPTTASQKYNGSTWSDMSSIPSAYTLGMGGGNSTDAFSAGGSNTTSGNMGSSPINTNYLWNGSSWSTGNNLSASRNMGAGGGNTSSGLIWGGTYSQLASSDEFDGTNWSAGGNLPEGIRGFNGDAANNSSGFSVGGYNGSGYVTTTQQYDGTSWTAANAAIGNGSTQGDHGGCGTKISFLSAIANSSAGAVDYYNGTTWSTTASTNSDRRSIYGGDGTKAFKASGDSVGSVTTEYYNGTSWASSGNMETSVRQPKGAGGNT